MLSVTLSAAASSSGDGAEPLVIETYLQNSYPKYIALDNGGFSGWAVDVMRAIEAVDPQLQFRFPEFLIPFVRIHAALENGSIDLFIGTIRNAERDQRFHFIEPGLFPTHNVLVVRADYDASAIRSLADVLALGEQGRILVDRGTAHEAYLRQFENAHLDTGVVERSMNIDKLLAGRADFYYSTDIGVYATANEMGVHNQLHVLPFTVQEEWQYAAFSLQADPEKIARVEQALALLANTGILQQIWEKYR